MKIDIFGAEQKSFRDKKDGRDVVYYRAYGFKPTKREKGVGCVYCEIKIDEVFFKSISNDLANGTISCELDFDENGRVIDWVIL